MIVDDHRGCGGCPRRIALCMQSCCGSRVVDPAERSLAVHMCMSIHTSMPVCMSLSLPMIIVFVLLLIVVGYSEYAIRGAP